MNALLLRQLRKSFGLSSDEDALAWIERVTHDEEERSASSNVACPPSEYAHLVRGLKELITRVNDSYEFNERDIELRDRSLRLSSEELIAANKKIRAEVVEQKQVIDTLRHSVNKLLTEQNKPTIDDAFTNISDLSTLVLELIKEQKTTRSELIMQRQALDKHGIVATVDLNGTILSANDKCCQFSGFTREELIGKNTDTFNVNNVSKAQQKDIAKALTKGNIWQGELHSVTKSGEPRAFFATAVPFHNHHNWVDSVVVICTDISEQKLLEKQLAEGRAFYRSITDSIGEGVYAVNGVGKTQFLNPKASELLGWTIEELEGRRFHDTVHFQKEDGTLLPRERCPVNHNIVQGQSYQSYEDYFTDKKGRLFPISIVAVPLKDKDGNPDGHVGVFRDISNQKATERQLQRAFEEAESANAAKSSFLATMSHEIRTPLNAIIGLTHLAIESSDIAQKQSYLEKVQKSSVSLLDLINSILDFSKVEANKVKLVNEPFSLRKIIDKLAQIFQYKAQQKHLQLLFDLRCNTNIRCIGDSEKIYQILLNLISNAIKFTHQGEIVFSVEQNGNTLTFGVSDTGMGISKENQGKLFKAFEQVDATISRKFGGTGLGLAICDKLVKQMGGILTVSSEIGQGSHFSFSLPLCENNCPSVASPLPVALPREVLCIKADDSVNLCTEIINATFTRLGMKSYTIARDASSYPAQAEHTLLVLPESEKAWKQLVGDIQDNKYQHLNAQTLVSPLPKEEVKKRVGEALYHSISIIELPFTDSDLISALSPSSNSQQPQKEEGLESKKWRRLRLREKSALVVDDDLISLEVSQQILADLGMHVTTASSAEQADTICEHNSFDVILLDCYLPGVDGYQLAEKLSQQEGWFTPIIALSADESPEASQRALNAGMCQHLTKPATADEIIHTIDIHIHSGYKEVAPPVSTTPATEFLAELLSFYDKYSRAEVMSQLLDMLHGESQNPALIYALENDSQHIGATALYNCVVNTISKLRGEIRQESDYISNMSMQLDATLRLIAHTIERFPDQKTSTITKQEVNVELFLRELQTVVEKLEHYDVKAIDELARFSNTYSDTTLALQINKIKQFVNVYDFDGALKYISNMKEELLND
ncbi:hypothetical protein D210916BOD24_03770 [Alteromonas sp. D210916BOD_24]